LQIASDRIEERMKKKAVLSMSVERVFRYCGWADLSSKQKKIKVH
jgi:hypothetical protein